MSPPSPIRTGEEQSAKAVADLLARGWTTALPRRDIAGLAQAGIDAAHRVFALGADRKATFVDPSGSGNVGWRQAARNDRPDEVWQLGGGGPDLWPAELEADRMALSELRVRCAEITADLLGALAPALDLPRAELRECASTTESVTRLLHYPARADGVGFAPHTDLGLATFFVAESVPCLELKDEVGRWRWAGSRPAVAAGEMLTMRTQDRIRAGRHRVRAPSRERWAVAVFVHPRPGYVLGADETGQPITASGFFQRALAAHTGVAGSAHGSESR